MDVPPVPIVKPLVAADNEPLYTPEPSEDGRGDADDAMGDDAMVSTVAELQKRVQRSEAHMAELQAQEHEDVVQVLAMLGGDPRSFRREQKQAVRRIVSEIYSPPRVTAMLRNMTDHGLTPGLALDITVLMASHGTSQSRANVNARST